LLQIKVNHLLIVLGAYIISRAKTVAENLKMSEAVLSRFDLIFILLDKPDEQRDEMISDHVMAVRNPTRHDHYCNLF